MILEYVVYVFIFCLLVIMWWQVFYDYHENKMEAKNFICFLIIVLLQLFTFCKINDLVHSYIGEGLKMCKNYVGVSCVDGTCPRLDLDLNCENCYCNYGCEDCALRGTEYCDKKEMEVKMKYQRYGYSEKTGCFTRLPIKDITKTVRLDADTYGIIDAMPGKNFSEKLRRLAYQFHSMTNNPEQK